MSDAASHRRRKRMGYSARCAEYSHWACYGRMREPDGLWGPCMCPCHPNNEPWPKPTLARAVTGEASELVEIE